MKGGEITRVCNSLHIKGNVLAFWRCFVEGKEVQRETFRALSGCRLLLSAQAFVNILSSLLSSTEESGATDETSDSQS